MEPDVLGEAVLDEVLVLMLVEPHEDGVVTGVGPRLEVEHHPESLSGSPPKWIEEGRGDRAAKLGDLGSGTTAQASGGEEGLGDPGERNRVGGISRVSCADRKSVV